MDHHEIYKIQGVQSNQMDSCTTV